MGNAVSTEPQKPPKTTSQSTGRVVAKATGLMIMTIFLSRLLGFVRESLLIAYFGRSGLTDIYKLSFTVPDMLYFLIAGGALNSAFIPVFTKYLTEGKEEDAWKVFSTVMCVALAVATALIVVGEAFAAPFSRLIAPGISDRAEAIAQVAYLTKIVLPAQAFFFMGSMMMGTLYSRNKFLAPAFGPLLYNAVIIIGGLITARVHSADIAMVAQPAIAKAIHVYCSARSTPAELAAVLNSPAVLQHGGMHGILQTATRAVSGYSWGALIGAFLGNVLIQLIVMMRLGMRFKPSFDVRHEGVRRVFALMLPVILGLSLPQVDVMINRYFGNMLSAGAVVTLDNANRLMQLPYGVFGQAFGVAIFPTLAALAAQRLWSDYRSQLSQGIRGIVFMTLPASVLMMVLAVPIIRFVFEHGKLFNAQDTNITAFTMMLYCAGVFVWSMQAIIARGFYALHDTVTVVVTGTIVTVIFVAMNLIFIHTPWARESLAPGGLALTTTIAAGIHTFALMWLLRNRIGGIDGKRICRSLVRMFVASGVMALVVWIAYERIESLPAMSAMLTGAGKHKMLATGVELIATTGIGVIVYGAAAWALKIEELQYAVSMFRGKFARRAAVASGEGGGGAE